MTNFRLRIPEQLKVGACTYAVSSVERAIDEKGEECDGITDSDTFAIQLKSSLTPQTKQLTLLHEIFHTIDDFTASHLTEDQVDRLSQALLMVLADNDLVECLDCAEEMPS